MADSRTGARLVGDWLDRAYWGRGVATMALRAFLPLAGAPPFAQVARDRWGSRRVLEKCGFVLNGEADGDLRSLCGDPRGRDQRL